MMRPDAKVEKAYLQMRPNYRQVALSRAKDVSRPLYGCTAVRLNYWSSAWLREVSPDNPYARNVTGAA